MEKGTKKFILWLILGNVLALIIIIALGFIFIKSNYNARFEQLGRAMAIFLLFGNVAVVLIRKTFF